MEYLFGLWISAGIGFLVGAVWCGTKMQSRLLDLHDQYQYEQSTLNDG